jgi:hypothetical protein
VAPGCLRCWSSIRKKLHLAHLTSIRAKRTRCWHIKSTCHGVCHGDATLAPGCGQTRGEHTQFLTSSGRRVARVSSADHLKVASKKASLSPATQTLPGRRRGRARAGHRAANQMLEKREVEVRSYRSTSRRDHPSLVETLRSAVGNAQDLQFICSCNKFCSCEDKTLS